MNNRLIKIIAVGVVTLCCLSITVVLINYSLDDSKDSKKIAFLGDSLTYGAYLKEYGYDREKTVWTHIVSEHYNSIEYNYGLNGNEMGRPDGRSFIDRSLRMIDDADLIIVFGGTNDYWWDVPLGTPDSNDRINYYGALNILTNQLIEKYPNKPIIFINPHNQYSTVKGVNSDYINHYGYSIDGYRNAVNDVCNNKPIHVMNLQEYLQFDIGHNNEDRTEYSFDGCHFNAKGHECVAQSVIKYIEHNHITF